MVVYENPIVHTSKYLKANIDDLSTYLGYVDPGEDISAAAVREVREETGVDTQFR